MGDNILETLKTLGRLENDGECGFLFHNTGFQLNSARLRKFCGVFEFVRFCRDTGTYDVSS